MAGTPAKTRKTIDIGFYCLIIIYFIVKLFFVNYIPIWDGYLYFDQLMKVVNEPLKFSNYIAFGHPSVGYMLLMSLVQYIEKGNVYLLNIENTLLGILAIYSFYRIVCYFYNGSKNKLEILLVSFCMAFNPVIFGNSINFNIDFPVAVFFLASLYSLLYRRMFLFSFFATMMAFSKESGTLLYFELIATLVIIFLLIGVYEDKDKGQIKTKAEILKGRLKNFFSTLDNDSNPHYIKNYIYLFMPLALFVMYFIYRVFIKRVSLFWGGTTLNTKSFGFLLSFPFHHMLSIFVQIFIYNFHWIFTLGIIAFLIKILINHRSKKEKIFSLPDEKSAYMYVLILIFLGFAYINFSYNTFSNSRYIMPAIPLLIIFFYGGLQQLIKKHAIRLAVLLLIFLLSFIQTFSTIDPVSKAIYGTFDFGNHKMLRMVTITGEGLGYAGRDQLVYNAEFTVINKLVQKLYQEQIIKEDKNICFDDYADYFVLSSAGNGTKTKTVQISELLNKKKKPKNITYINFPWMAQEKSSLQKLSGDYKITNTRSVEDKGYKINVFSMKLKSEKK